MVNSCVNISDFFSKPMQNVMNHRFLLRIELNKFSSCVKQIESLVGVIVAGFELNKNLRRT